MRRTSLGFLLIALLPAACAVAPPSGPSVLAVPGQGKDFNQFQVDEAQCRNYAQYRIGPVTPGQAANQSAVGSAAIGTLLGAAAGAAIGSVSGNLGAGAAIGAGTGLLVGSAAGASNAGIVGGDLQRQYDFAYIQCMTGKGQSIQSTAPGFPVYAAPAPYYAPYYYPTPAPFVGSFYFGGGPGYYGHGYYGRGYRGWR